MSAPVKLTVGDIIEVTPDFAWSNWWEWGKSRTMRVLEVGDKAIIAKRIRGGHCFGPRRVVMLSDVEAGRAALEGAKQ